ncbi:MULTISPECIES: hypothetical protein [unclassified Streptomyces]|uniref:hypothetical protein n=1 Tax=unclassified Streptomyces TaxID=2593676 RepID=UPI001F2D1098|nr:MULTISPECIES: hypothetical protein [unclassified Streptomyces]MCF0086698.1 hypothetical protein [Streptomyces sp. MH192]MCF0098852.1 hypothetical protein [Streptomyces sp. MH191]
MDTQRDIYQQLAIRDGRQLLTAIRALPDYKPRPGTALAHLRITVEVVDGPELGSVEKNSVNIHDLARLIARQAEGLRAKFATTAPARPALRVLGGGQ